MKHLLESYQTNNMNNSPIIAAIVPAAGVGSRMLSDIPKQYLRISENSILEHTVNKLNSVPELSSILLAVNPQDTLFGTQDFMGANLKTTPGGKERADSVLNALIALESEEPDWVLVHDAARPVVRVSDIQKLIKTCIKHNQGGILAAKVKDTIKRGHTHSLETVPRDELWHALTPQLFPYHALKNALSACLTNSKLVTDEASAMELQGQSVLIVEGRSDNIKITTPEDLALAAFLIAEQEKKND